MSIQTTEIRSALMSRMRVRDTRPELLLRKAVWALGIQYRLQRRIEGTKPDMVFVGPKVAVFVDGCFWHQCPLHCVSPKNNQAFWKQKLDRNVERDRQNTNALEKADWLVIRFWEHEIEESPQMCAEKIADLVRRRKEDARRLA